MKKRRGGNLPPAQNNIPRYALLDELRGLAVIAMVIYHSFYLLADVFGSTAGRMLIYYTHHAQPFIAGTFFLICGICSRLSRSNAKRGLRLLGLALLLTLATWLFQLWSGADVLITFGALHFLAAALLLFSLAEKPLEALPVEPQIFVFALLFLLTAGPLYGGFKGFGVGPWMLRFPWTESFPLFILGFPNYKWSSADYIPLIPWLFLFLTGTAVGLYAKRGEFPQWLEQPRCAPLRWVGKHALWIFLLHQPVMFGIVTLYNWIF